jgi:hypothetical protein
MNAMSDDTKGTLLAMPGVSRPDQPAGAQPVPEVVEFIEEILADAKCGGIQSIAVAYVRPGNITGYGFAVGPNGSHDIFAAITDLFYSCAHSRYHRGEAKGDDEQEPA